MIFFNQHNIPRVSYESYLVDLKKVVASSKAPVLKLTMVAGLRKKRNKELKIIKVRYFLH